MLIDIEKLRPHPRNNYFFDDMTGDKWEDFKESISHRLIHAVVVTQDLVIVSGHQRYRAYKELGKTQIEVEIRHYDSDDEVLLDLINSNLKERVVGNDNPVKLGRCFAEIDRINGVQHGGDRKSKVQNAPLISREEVAEQYGISTDKWKRYKSLTRLIPELEDMVETGRVTATTASAIARKLSPEEQKKFFETFRDADKVSSEKAQDAVRTIIEGLRRNVDTLTQEKEIARSENAGLYKSLSELKRETSDLRDENFTLKEAHQQLVQKNAELQTELEESQSRQPEVVEKVVEKTVAPDDYEQLKRDAKKADAYRQDFENQRIATGEKQQRIMELKSELDRLRAQTAREQSGNDLRANAVYFGMNCKHFIEDNAGYVYIASEIGDLPEKEQKQFLEIVKGMYAWAQNLMTQIERSLGNDN